MTRHFVYLLVCLCTFQKLQAQVSTRAGVTATLVTPAALEVVNQPVTLQHRTDKYVKVPVFAGGSAKQAGRQKMRLPVIEQTVRFSTLKMMNAAILVFDITLPGKMELRQKNGTETILLYALDHSLQPGPGQSKEQNIELSGKVAFTSDQAMGEYVATDGEVTIHFN